jgi:cobalt-precorrin-5B (C1)-methyltransferase
MEKVKGDKLRTGWTTGTCAAAAAKAAARALATGEPQARVDVKLPKRARSVASGSRSNGAT